MKSKVKVPSIASRLDIPSFYGIGDVCSATSKYTILFRGFNLFFASICRLQLLKSLRWEFGRDLPISVKNNLSPSEVEWFDLYCNLLDSYMSKLNEGRGLDLTLQRKPPKRLYVQVRCLQEYGEYALDDGTSVILSKDSTVSSGKSDYFN